MHLEVIVEDQSGAKAIDILLDRLLGPNQKTHSWRLHAYKGIGKLPANLNKAPDPRKRLLLDKLPAILRAHGRANVPDSAVVVVVDSDRKECGAFKTELLKVLKGCDPAPKALLRIAIEEIEAWYLGDAKAIRAAYPKAKTAVLSRYVQDSVCGTWEVLADAVYPGGAKQLNIKGWPIVGKEKSIWAERISPFMDVEANRSPSFKAFRDGVRHLVTT